MPPDASCLHCVIMLIAENPILTGHLGDALASPAYRQAALWYYAVWFRSLPPNLVDALPFCRYDPTAYPSD
jgi:hypothetical protein